MIKLNRFGFLGITGRDAIKFLQGYTTCDLDDLTPEMSALGGVCNIQGRMVSNFRVVRTEDGVLMRMDRSLVEPTMTFLGKYIVFSKATMADLSDAWHCYGSLEATPENDATPRAVSRLQDGFSVCVDSTGRRELWLTTPAEAPSDPHAWWTAEIDAGMAWLSAETTETFIPQMLNLHAIDGIDFDKGCYLGQEIVARMQYRGNLNRRLCRGSAQGGLAVGGSLLAGNRQVGTLVAVEGERFLAVVQSKDGELPALETGDGHPAQAAWV